MYLKSLLGSEFVGDGGIAFSHGPFLVCALLSQFVLEQLEFRVEFALLFLEDGVAVGLIFVKETSVAQFGGQSLRFAFPLGDDLALLFDFLVGVVEFLFQLFLDGHHLLQIVLVLLGQPLLGQFQFAGHALALLAEDVRLAVVIVVVVLGRAHHVLATAAVQAGRAVQQHFHFHLFMIARQFAEFGLVLISREFKKQTKTNYVLGFFLQVKS